MKTLRWIILCCTALGAAGAFAHSTEPVVTGPLTAKKAHGLAERMIDSLLHANMLDAGWKKRKFKSSASRESEGGKLWVVTYINPTETDPEKKTLYLFFDDDGKYLDNNHHGHLRGTKP